MAVVLLGIVAVVIGVVAWLLGTGSGARAVLGAAGGMSGGVFHAEGISGRITGTLHVQRLSLAQADGRTVLSDVRLHWQPRRLLDGTVHVETLHVGHLQIDRSESKEREPRKLPDRIGLPVKLQVDDLRLQSGDIRSNGTSLVRLGPTALRLVFDGNRYDLQLRHLATDSPLGSGRLANDLRGNATLSAAKPYALDARIASDGTATIGQQTFDATGTINLNGSLQQLQAMIDIAVDRASVDGTVMLHPFSESPLGRASLAARAIDLNRFDPQWPSSALELRVNADEHGAGELHVANPEAGLWDAKKLPLQSLQLSFRQEAGRMVLDRLTAALGAASRPAGTVTGQGEIGGNQMTLQIRTEGLNLKRLDGRARATKLAGSADLERNGSRQEIRLSLSEPLERQQRITLDAHALLDGQILSIKQAELRAGSGRIDFSGQAALDGDKAFRAEGKVDRFRLRELGNFPQLPALELNAGFTLRGKREPRLDADLSYTIADSTLAGQPLSGSGEVRLRGENLEIPRLLLASGANRLNAEGRLTGDDAVLSFRLDAPQLGQLGADFGGAIAASGTARGTLDRPRISAEWTARSARVPGGMRIERMQGKAQLALDRKRSLPLERGTAELDGSGLQLGDERIAALSGRLQFSPNPDAPLDLVLQAKGIATQRLKAERFAATAKGTTGAHTIDLALDETGQAWTMRASGGLGQIDTAPRWKGSVQALDAKGRFSARLSSPAPLLLSAEKVQLEQFLLDADAGRFAVEMFARDSTGIVTRGHIERLQVARLLGQIEPAPRVRTDLVLAGEWNVRLADTLNGTLALRRQGGDLTVLANAPVTLGLSALSASATLTAGRLNADIQTEGKRLGRIRVQGATTIGHGDNRLAIAPDAPLSGNADIDVPSLAWVAPLLSPAMTLEGSLKGDVSLGGNVEQPRLAGRITGQALRVLLSDLGLDLRQGSLDSEFQGNRWLVRNLNFQGAEGRITLSGPIDVSGGSVTANLSLLAERFALLNRSDRRIIVSGASELEWRGNQGKATGTFTVNSGFVDLGSADKPRLSDDVVIVGQEHKNGANKTAFDVDISVALDDSVALKGRGLDAMLGGQVRLLSKAGEALQAQGSINVAKGTYSAYGRELAIEQGLLRFRGPLNNPSLDILAMRRGQEVEAGVSIRGTALTPRVTLVSEPPVPDAEKLSWLVLGRGLAAAGDTDIGALQSAAGALLSEGAKAGVQSRIASTFGLDTFSIGTSQDTLQQRIVTIGKQVSSRLYLSYQQGLESAGSVVQVRYALSPKLSLEAEAGSRSAISLFYNIAFD
ncbi:translocation/assembly module TamB domain-containing protein [Noviherbaspirillum sp. ST9]|uniref:translocation/assembly module TamB domain-containing protein n=1 Tax=Noviherbaspirillum sp. ST9 TaxID=3401606 RepID=UPI003B588545